jgi:hypothetical protein
VPIGLRPVVFSKSIAKQSQLRLLGRILGPTVRSLNNLANTKAWSFR